MNNMKEYEKQMAGICRLQKGKYGSFNWGRKKKTKKFFFFDHFCIE